ncbi:flotillin-like FloA family protein [Aporhodopirellula aestuarii]|uniref:Flotillin-like FloA family protein n=1 Tax=Aporhodopirellula aestuarii TaxID=2950107 RepID=A0ABT0U5Z9_9BACT|nr:flotillin-like FloA family protein [Aporhodopirellula aestuarii]MCM2372344.1 flotillin-like FloA family protein [Aporhodopirellula aestuarii]
MNELLLPLMFIVIGLVFLSAVVAFVTQLFRPWLQCFLGNAPVSLPEILAMRLRGSPVRQICEQRIKASFVGVDLSARQLEEVYLKGADVEKLVDALCQAHRTNQDIGWDDLLQTDLNRSPGPT